MNTLIPGAPLRSLSPTTNEYQRAQGESRAAKPARAARFTLDAPEHSGTIPGARGDILTPGVALTSNLAVIFTLNQHSTSFRIGSASNSRWRSVGVAVLPRRTPLRISTEPFEEYRETSSVGRVLRWFADGPLSASSRRRRSSGVSKAIAIWALSFTRLEANRNLLTAMSLLPKSIHRCRCYPTKFNSGRDIPEFERRMITSAA